MSFLYSVLSFLLIITLLVFVHEFGHFFFARLFGVRVETFSIGFGRKLFGFRDKKGTVWQIAPIPLGGFVRMFGEYYILQKDKLEQISSELKEKAFIFKPLYQRILIVFAGPLANFIFAIFCFAIIYMVQGMPVSIPMVEVVIENSPAAKAGIEVGDVIKKIDGKDIKRFQDVKEIVFYSADKPLEFELLRNEKLINITVVPYEKIAVDMFENQHHIGFVGIQGGSIRYENIGFIKSILEGTRDLFEFIKQMGTGIYRLIVSQNNTEEVGSIIRIADMSGKVTQFGFAPTLWFIGILSINLGLINLLPIPVLDGGHLLFYAIEAIRGKAIGIKAYNIATKIGFFVIIFLSVWAISNDVVFFLSK